MKPKKLFTAIFSFDRRICIRGFAGGTIQIRIKKEPWMEFNYKNFKEHSHKFTALELDYIWTFIKGAYEDE